MLAEGEGVISVTSVIVNAFEINIECYECGAENEMKSFPGM